MEEKAKKMKAAIMGVIYFLQQEKQEKENTSNIWARSSRETIMQNRTSVQSRSFGLGWQRK